MQGLCQQLFSLLGKPLEMSSGQVRIQGLLVIERLAHVERPWLVTTFEQHVVAVTGLRPSRFDQGQQGRFQLCSQVWLGLEDGEGNEGVILSVHIKLLVSCKEQAR